MNEIILTGNAIGSNQYGGVKNFITKFMNCHSSNFNKLTHFSFGESPNWSFDKSNLSPLKYRVGLLAKLFHFIVKLCKSRVNLIHHNTGMSIHSVLREFPFMMISLIFLKRRVLFFHGWNDQEYFKIKNSWFLLLILRFMVNSSHAIFVLSNKFKKNKYVKKKI